MGATIRYRDHAGSSSSRNEVVMAVDVRVWITGVEVTDYLIGEVSVTRAVGETEGTCSFTLDNNFDRFIIRPENLGGKSPAYDFLQGKDPSDSWKYLRTDVSFPTAAEVPEENIKWLEDAKNEKRGTFTFDESAKRDMFEYKAQQMLNFENIANIALINQYSTGGSTGNMPPMNTGQAAWRLPKYDLTVGSCVLNLHDEVRLFLADPNQDPLSDADRRWMPLFSGVISSIPVKHNRVQGSSDISVACSDVRYIMKKMRVAGNFQSADQKKTYVHFDNAVGMFQDTIAASSENNLKFENNVSSLSYRQITRAVLCGDTEVDINTLDIKNSGFGTSANPGNEIPLFDRLAGSNPYNDKALAPREHSYNESAHMRGLGTFSLGNELCYDNSAFAKVEGMPTYLARAKFMEKWNDICLFGIKQDWYTTADVEEIGRGTKPFVNIATYHQQRLAGGQDANNVTASAYSVFNGFVHYLFPGPNTGAMGIRNAMERAKISPGSDVNFQNRLDILAQTSANIDYKFYVTPIGDVVFEFPMYDFMPSAFGKYAACYVVHDSVKDDEFNDEGDGNVVTGLVVRGGFSAHDNGSDTETNETVKDQGFSMIVKSDYMASKYGITVEDHSIQWLDKIWPSETQDAAGNKVDSNTLNRNTLASFGVIEFYKRIAAMSSMTYSGIYNPFLLPNRPILNRLSRRMGVTASCSIGVPIDGAPTSSVDAYFIRKADHDGKFNTICGGQNTPFDYSGNGLALFTTAQLDGLRFKYGIEIIDPAQSMVYNAAPAMVAGAMGLDNATYPAPVGTTNRRKFSVSPSVKIAFDNYAKLAKSNPRLYRLIGEAAALKKMDPRILFQIMCFESGGHDHINPRGYCEASGAQGVIQFLPTTLIALDENPDTFLSDYPTVESQMVVVKKYLASLPGNLDNPYDAYMAIANPASRKDDPFTPFTNSSNAITRKNSRLMTKNNGGAQCGADFLKKLGYNYYNTEGGVETDSKGRKVKYVPAGDQSSASTPIPQQTVVAKPAGLTVTPTVTTSAAAIAAVTGTTDKSFIPTKKNAEALKTQSSTSAPKPPVVTPATKASVLKRATDAVINEKIQLPTIMTGVID